MAAVEGNVTDMRRIARGWTSSIYQVPNETKVVKVLDRETPKQLYERELAAYQRMSTRDSIPSSILRFYGAHPDIEYGIILEKVDGSQHGFDLWTYLQYADPPECRLLLRWAEQLAEALQFVHTCDIIHADIHTANCFVDSDLNLRLGDFGACAIDDQRSLLTYRRTHQLWILDSQANKWKKAVNIDSEIFAFGCTLYNMETHNEPFQQLQENESSSELFRRLQHREMPSLDVAPVLGSFISKCWDSVYLSMSDVLHDLRASQDGNEVAEEPQ